MEGNGKLPKYVHYLSARMKYRVLVYKGKHVQSYGGYYDTIAEAVIVRDRLCKELGVRLQERKEGVT